MALKFTKLERKYMEPEQSEEHKPMCRYEQSNAIDDGRIMLYTNFKNWFKCAKMPEMGRHDHPLQSGPLWQNPEYLKRITTKNQINLLF